MIDVTPRSRTTSPPPGAPEFCVIMAPASLPWSDCSTLAVGALTSASELTVATALARFFRSMPVA